ncbi:hypothetical protein Taro_027192 [Colocasia esculenta]|uniref:DUF7733 domain-containing protein n=1 Tax=Colocasia esculenta TaxID=4460 RepID=A0A843VTM4_COLES|nr:hypothetical protein [Colocasia esculenta]
MSGVTLAVGPRTEPDRTMTTASSPTAKQQHARHPSRKPVVGGVMGSLRVIELQLVAFIMVFSASGLVPLLDLAYPALVTLYLFALSRLAFPSAGPVAAAPREVFEGGLFFRLYVVVGTLVGLFLPLAYVLGGFARGDDYTVRSATPHLFLLSCQILTENLVTSFGVFSPPVRALVPLLYTVRRIFVIIDWIYDVCFNKTLPATARLKDVAWLWFGRGLALANLIYFSVNLFAFLLPRFLPRAFERYFKERDEARAKSAEDERAPHSPAAAAAAAGQTETNPREEKKAD